MRTEISLANTFLDVSEISRVITHQKQARLDALVAYHSLLHFLPKLRLTTEETFDFASGMEALRLRLVAAGFAL